MSDHQLPVWNPQVVSDIEQNLLDASDIALQQSIKLGASQAEVSIGQGQGMSVTVRNAEVETVEHNRDKSMGVTVYFGNRSGNASTTDFSESAIRAAVASASNIARYTEEDEYNGLPEVELLATEFPDLDLHHPWNIEMEQAMDIARRCEQAALNEDPRVKNTEGASLSSHDGTDLYANSYGFRGFSRSSRHSTSCSVIAGEGDAMQRDYWYDSKRHFEDLNSAEEIGRETSRRTTRRLGARKIKTGSYPIIFEPAVASSLMSHLISAISGSALYRKASFLLDKKGEQIFPKGIDIFEQPFLKRASGSTAFDAEGVATRANKIVEDGVLQSYVLSSYSARKLGMQTTGNAGGTHNLTLSSNLPHGLEQMIKDMGRGVVISELIGFGINTVTGDYSRGAFGFWVENGEIQYPVEEFTIASNLSEMYKSLNAIGNDVDESRNIRTGSIMIDQMTVAGEM